MGKKTRFGYKPLASKYCIEMVETLPLDFKLDFGHILYMMHGTRPLNFKSQGLLPNFSVISNFKNKKEVQWEVCYEFQYADNWYNRTAIGTFEISDEYLQKINEARKNGLHLILSIKAKPLDRFIARDGKQKIIPIEVVGLLESPL